MLLDGNKLSKRILHTIEKNIKKHHLKPGLAVILIGKKQESVVYVNLKQRAAQRIGIKFLKYQFQNTVEQVKINNLIKRLNKNKTIHGIIVQLPLPKHLPTNDIIQCIAPEKDVDGFQHKAHFLSPTHQAIMRLLKATKQNLEGKKAVIINKNPVFYNPLILLLEKLGVSVSTQAQPTQALKSADIIISALGIPHCIKPEMVKKNAIVIDVGYSRIKNKSMGDVDPQVEKKASYISPVPGGVGPLTVSYLLRNVYCACKRLKKMLS